MSLKKEIQFSKSERAAIAFFILLLLISYCYHIILEPGAILDQSTMRLEEILHKKPENEINEVKKKVMALTSIKKKKQKIFYYPPPRYEAFNPNMIDSLKWIQFGVKPWTISTIMKYKSKGGKFYNCQDLSKVYNLPDSTFQELLPFCKIPDKKWNNQKSYSKRKNYSKKALPESKDSIWKKKPAKTYVPIVVDINTSDTSTLSKLYGIGSILAQRIAKYRRALGGFHSIEQLAEVYGVEQEVIDNNIEKLQLSGTINKLNINSIADTLAKHPYISWPKAKIISNYRKQHGNFENITELKNIKALSDSLYIRLVPYLSLE